MVGLAFIGTSLILGVFIRISAWTGAALLVLLYISAFPPVHNPVVDGHLVYAVALGGIALSDGGDALGLGVWWRHTHLVQRFPFLR
jgi:thiosulfate dehydrogenase [quinone] large subunit